MLGSCLLPQQEQLANSCRGHAREWQGVQGGATEAAVGARLALQQGLQQLQLQVSVRQVCAGPAHSMTGLRLHSH